MPMKAGGATINGKVQPETKTAAFIAATEASVYVPLSGRIAIV